MEKTAKDLEREARKAAKKSRLPRPVAQALRATSKPVPIRLPDGTRRRRLVAAAAAAGLAPAQVLELYGKPDKVLHAAISNGGELARFAQLVLDVQAACDAEYAEAEGRKFPWGVVLARKEAGKVGTDDVPTKVGFCRWDLVGGAMLDGAEAMPGELLRDFFYCVLAAEMEDVRSHLRVRIIESKNADVLAGIHVAAPSGELGVAQEWFARVGLLRVVPRAVAAFIAQLRLRDPEEALRRHMCFRVQQMRDPDPALVARSRGERLPGHLDPLVLARIAAGQVAALDGHGRQGHLLPQVGYLEESKDGGTFRLACTELQALFESRGHTAEDARRFVNVWFDRQRLVRWPTWLSRRAPNDDSTVELVPDLQATDLATARAWIAGQMLRYLLPRMCARALRALEQAEGLRRYHAERAPADS